MKYEEAGKTVRLEFNTKERKILLSALRHQDFIVALLTDAADEDARPTAEHAANAAVRDVTNGVKKGKLKFDVAKDFIDVEVLIIAAEEAASVAPIRDRKAARKLARLLNVVFDRDE